MAHVPDDNVNQFSLLSLYIILYSSFFYYLYFDFKIDIINISIINQLVIKNY